MTTRPPEESDYDCAICLSPPDHQVHQCRNGHLFCAECLEECLSRASQAKCPTCRVALPREPIRNLVAERALARRPARCRPDPNMVDRHLILPIGVAYSAASAFLACFSL